MITRATRLLPLAVCSCAAGFPVTGQDSYGEAATTVIRDLQEGNPGITYLLDLRSFRPGARAEEITRQSELRHAERIREIAQGVGVALRDSAVDLREHDVALRLGDLTTDGDGARLMVSFRGPEWHSWGTAVLRRTDDAWSVQEWETHGMSDVEPEHGPGPPIRRSSHR